MAGTLRVPKVFYPQPVSGPQTFLIEYKLWSDPDSSYVVMEAAAVADVNGNISPAAEVTGLPSNELYYIRTSNNCQSPRNYYIQQKETE